jgi:glycosyltransferase involved in cell wall biosynthesis
MRVFYFITKSECGGAQSVVWELLSAHKKSGDEVIVMASTGGWLADETKAFGFLFIPNRFIQKTLNPILILRALFVYRSAVLEFKPDIVSLHSSFSGFIGRIGLLNRYPVIYTAHGWGFINGVSLPKKIIAIVAEKIGAYFCKKIICVSAFDQQIALSYAIAKEEKIDVIHNGVTITLDDTTDFTKENLSISFAGRLAIPKRQDILLEAYARLPSELRSRVNVVLIGGGQHENALRILANKLHIADNIQITGELPRNNALALRSRTDIAVLISDWEGFPLTNIEALQLGIPVIANNVGGMSEAIDATVGALLPAQVTSEDVALALIELIANEDLRYQKGIKAKERGLQYTGDIMSREVFALYASILKSYAGKA